MREFDPKVSICKLRFSDIGRGGATNLALALGTSALSLWVAVSDQGASSSVYIGKIAAATFTAVFLVYTQFEKIYKNLGKRVNREFEKHQISLGNTHLIDEFRKSAIDNVITLKTAFETIDKIHQLHRLRHKNIAELNKHNITDHKKLDDKIKGLIGTLENLSQVSQDELKSEDELHSLKCNLYIQYIKAYTEYIKSISYRSQSEDKSAETSATRVISEMTLRIEEAMRFMQRQERNKFTCMMFMYYLRAKARHTLAEIEADHIKKLQYINESIRDLKDQVLGVYTFNIGEVYHNLARLYTLKAEVHAQRNELAEEKSSWDRAVLYYNEAKNRGDIVVASLGEALVKAKQFPRAKAFIASALKTYPDNSSLNHLYSTALLGLGNYLEAYKYHNKSLQQCAEHDQSIYIEFFSKVLQQTHPEETYGVFTSRMKRESRSFCTKLCSSRGRQAQNAEGSSNLKSNTSGGDYKLVAGISL